MPKLHNTSPPARSDADAPAKNDTASRSALFRHRQQAMPAPPSPSGDSRTADYAVGHGRPPVQTRFRPGASGNPKGRPKGATGLNTLVRDMMTEKMPVRTAAGVTKKMPRVEVLLRKVFELALKGDPRAQSQLLTLYAAAVPEAPLDTLGGGETDDRLAELQELSRAFLNKALTEN
ncbi:MAG: DUF5681 domain-containing protein [Sphingomicrobium sp.]